MLDKDKITKDSSSYKQFIEAASRDIVECAREYDVPINTIINDIDVYAKKENEKINIYVLFAKNDINNPQIQLFLLSLKRQEKNFITCIKHDNETLAFLFNTHNAAYLCAVLYIITFKQTPSRIFKTELPSPNE